VAVPLEAQQVLLLGFTVNRTNESLCLMLPECHGKRKCGNLVAALRHCVSVPRKIIPQFGFGSREKRVKKIKIKIKRKRKRRRKRKRKRITHPSRLRVKRRRVRGGSQRKGRTDSQEWLSHSRQLVDLDLGAGGGAC